MDFNPVSYHLMALELINQQLYVNFSSLECNFFFERSEVYVTVVCCIVIL